MGGWCLRCCQDLEWLSDQGLTNLLHRTIVVLNDSDGHADKRTRALLAREFIDHGLPVVEVPFDPHLRPGGVIDVSHRNGVGDAPQIPTGHGDSRRVLRGAA